MIYETPEHIITRLRNFYGTLAVSESEMESAKFHKRNLYHGTIRHHCCPN